MIFLKRKSAARVAGSARGGWWVLVIPQFWFERTAYAGPLIGRGFTQFRRFEDHVTDTGTGLGR